MLDTYKPNIFVLLDEKFSTLSRCSSHVDVDLENEPRYTLVSLVFVVCVVWMCHLCILHLQMIQIMFTKSQYLYLKKICHDLILLGLEHKYKNLLLENSPKTLKWSWITRFSKITILDCKLWRHYSLYHFLQTQIVDFIHFTFTKCLKWVLTYS